MTARVAICEVAEVNPAIPPGLAQTPDTLVSFVPMSDLGEDGRLHNGQERPVAELLKGYTYFGEGDIIVAKITPCLENGKAAYVEALKNGHGFGSTEFHVLRPGRQVFGKYLFYMIWNPAFRHHGVRRFTGSAGQKRVPATAVAEFEIPLPSLSEQKRIATILDKADAICRRRQEAARVADQLIPSVFYEMFGAPGANRKKWPVERLARLVDPGDKINYGVVQPGSDFHGGVPIVRVGDFADMQIRTTALKRIDPQIEIAYERSRLRGDEVLLACVGSIGLVALADESLRGFNIVRAVARIRCGPRIHRFFLAWYLSTPRIQGYFSQETRTVSQPTLNIRQIEETPVFLPPWELQERFARLVCRYSLFKQHRHDLNNAQDDLFNSLVQRAFRGDL